MFSAKQGHYWYLDCGLNPGPPALEASTISIGYRGGGEMQDANVFLMHLILEYIWQVLRTVLNALFIFCLINSVNKTQKTNFS